MLKRGGHLFYTVPVVVGRLTRSRTGLPPSYHGTRAAGAVDDYRVQTEYGADFWCELFAAGFQNVALTSLIFPPRSRSTPRSSEERSRRESGGQRKRENHKRFFAKARPDDDLDTARTHAREFHPKTRDKF